MKESVSLVFQLWSFKTFIWYPVMARRVPDPWSQGKRLAGIPFSVSLGCLNLFPALSQCWWNTLLPGDGPEQEHFLHLAGGGQERQPWAVGIGFVLAPEPGLPSAELHWAQPFPSKCANPQEHPSRWVCPLDCFVQLLAACCLCAEV